MTENEKSIESMTEQEVREECERLAAEFLERCGYDVIERGWSCDAGVVDVVAEDGDTRVLVDVCGRRDLGSEEMPQLTVDREARETIRRRTLLYLASHPEVCSVRADVISLTIVGERTARLRHLIGAYQWTEE
jgi:putative endonuclease